jgi:A/G-specific adenine glycosylase
VENDSSDIGAARTRERFREVAQGWLDPANPAAFNQALMELGATVCLPRNPLCLVCPLAEICHARREGTAAQLPVKLRKQEAVRLTGELLVVERRGRILLRQRDAAASRMAGFWDLPSPQDLPGATRGAHLGEIRHTITHHHYTLGVRRATAAGALGDGFRWFAAAALNRIPLSTTARKALKLAGIDPARSVANV